jgi:hypothetical protein
MLMGSLTKPQPLRGDVGHYRARRGGGLSLRSALWNLSWCGRGPEGLQLMHMSLPGPSTFDQGRDAYSIE